MFKAIQVSRLYEQIVEQIQGSIVRGDLKPGDQFPPERELAERFGVSRTAVREAIRSLQEKGLVEAQVGRGTFVTDSRSRAVRQSLDWMTKLHQTGGEGHLVVVRELLEPEIAARAAGNRTEQDLSAMREAVAAMDAARDDAEAYIESDLDFHLALAEAADNPIILSLIDSIVGLLREQRSAIFQVPDGPRHGQFHHKRILEAVERGDPDAARQAMRAHLQQVRDDSELARRGAEAPDRTGGRP